MALRTSESGLIVVIDPSQLIQPSLTGGGGLVGGACQSGPLNLKVSE